MDTQNKTQNIIRSTLSGVGFAVLCLVIGTALDYAVTQVLSQFFIANCSENCYFDIFNFVFAIVVVLSISGGIGAGLRYYKRPTRQ